MRGKCLILMLLILVVATFATANINAYAHSDPQNYVKFYLWNPIAGSNIFTPQPSGTNVVVHLFIDSPASWHNTTQGIVGVTASLRVDPNVVTVITAAPMPDNNWDGRPDSFLGNYVATQGYNVLWIGGTVDAANGTITEPAEAIQGFGMLGRGAGGGPAPLFIFAMQTKSGVDHTTAYSLLHLFDCYYTTVDGDKHSVDIVGDGHYGTPPPQAEFTYTPSEPVVGETVTFNASASYDPDGNITSYEWDFGDETPPGTGNITTHTYNETGIYTVTLNVTDNDELWNTKSKNVTIYGPPIALFTYSPSEPSLGETVTFNASASYDPDGGNETYPSGIVSYDWDFGDEFTGTENDPIITHKYFEAGTYTVTLNVTDDEGSTKSKKKKVTVSGAAAAAELKVEVDVGSIHFRGEIAEFYVLTSFMGGPVNATQINARLYHGGTLHGDLSEFVENVTTGLYRVPYTIPIDASTGTYVLVVNASFFTQNGVSFKSFLLSPTLTDQNALITDIEGDIATILTDVGAIKANLTDIDATLVGMEGTIAIIHSTIGEFTAPADTICATLTAIEGTVTTIDSTLGSIEADIEDINGEITGIDGTLVAIQTSIGLIETDVTSINATIADIQDGLVTINSTLGDIQLDLADVKDDISFELVSVIGDIKEGLADVTAAITDAEGNILLELGQVEVKLEDINATLEIIDGSLVTIKTDIGTIKGTITSIRGDIATIETDIGTIKAILEEWTGVTTSSITTPVGAFDIMVLTNSTLEGPVTFSDNALTIIVSGQTGTTGILNVKIPRQLLIGVGSNIEELAVTINGKQVSFTYTEEAELYVLRTIYTHSTHTIKIYLSESQTSQELALWILLVAAFTIAISAIVATPYILAARKRPIKQDSPPT